MKPAVQDRHRCPLGEHADLSGPGIGVGGGKGGCEGNQKYRMRGQGIQQRGRPVSVTHDQNPGGACRQRQRTAVTEQDQDQ
ncbi:MAG: hypothetical protein SVR04_10060 [Spirochaetota bacterium]|nr:hypothetical protein [Spirochaetota bacterium]